MNDRFSVSQRWKFLKVIITFIPKCVSLQKGRTGDNFEHFRISPSLLENGVHNANISNDIIFLCGMQ